MSDRTVDQCELYAELTGFTGAVAGHFPDLPFPPPPTFKPDLPPSALRLTPIPRRIADRVRALDEARERGEG